MRRYWIGVLILFLAACSNVVRGPAETPGESLGMPDLATQDKRQPEEKHIASLPDLGPAPELENEVWLNVEQPLKIVDLRGKVVLLDMWTFG